MGIFFKEVLYRLLVRCINSKFQLNEFWEICLYFLFCGYRALVHYFPRLLYLRHQGVIDVLINRLYSAIRFARYTNNITFR